MTNRIPINQLYTTRVPGKPLANTVNTSKQQPTVGPERSFKQVLGEQLIRFSHHAEQRLQQRGIEFKAEQLRQLQTAVTRAAEKGAQDSLIMIQDVALIVNVKNKTVVTALDGPSMQDHVFTQIDSAVIIT